MRRNEPPVKSQQGSGVVLLAALSAVALLAPRAADAEPYLAVRYGYKCSQCHLNPTGGGKRNRFGIIYSQTELPNKVLSASDLERFLNLGRRENTNASSASDGEAPSEPEPESETISSALSDVLPDSTFYSGYPAGFFSVGGDFRFNNRTVFRGADDSLSNTFDITQANLYASLEFFEGAVALYLDETVAPGGASSREAFGILRGPWDSYLKAGRMVLPFGLRLQDDTAFIREITGFNHGVQDLGIEAGLEPGPWSLHLAMSNGTQGSSDDNRDKQVTGMVSFLQRHWRVGAHATWNNSPGSKRIAVGGFAGVHLGRFSLLGEIDHIIDDLKALPDEPIERRLLLYGAVNYHLAKGVNLKFTYDFANPDLSVSDISFIRVSTGIEYTVMQFLQLRLFYRFRDDTEDSLRDDESILDFEIHMFF